MIPIFGDEPDLMDPVLFKNNNITISSVTMLIIMMLQVNNIHGFSTV